MTEESQGAAALEVQDLDVVYRIRGRERQVLRELSFHIERGETFGLVGESGCGKSTAALAIVRYLARNGRVRAGRIRVAGRDVLGMGTRDLQRFRASEVSMVYQEPGRALNPGMRIGNQIEEALVQVGAAAGAPERARELLRRVQIADADRVLRSYPHQLSGGMQQRVIVAMALAAKPSLLILDEPTTALDTTVGAEVLELVRGLRDELSTSVLIISHNLALVADMCDRVGVLYAGALVEEGRTEQVFARPRHPYTVGLLRCIPQPIAGSGRHRLQTIPGALPPIGADLTACVYATRCPLADDRCHTERPPAVTVGNQISRCFHHERAAETGSGVADEPPAPLPVVTAGPPLFSVRGVRKTFRYDGVQIPALRNVSVELRRGETLALVGESGSGKTTLARILLGLTEADSVEAFEIDGEPLAGTPKQRAATRADLLQIVFQNPDAALNRRHRVARIIGRVVTKRGGLRGKAREQRVRELADAVKLSEQHLSQRPSGLSGGLKQRVGIARAFAGGPRVVVCDEPTSALDVSVQAAILNLLVDLQREEAVSYLFISHDLGVVRYLADRVMVLYLGRVMEVGPADRVFAGPHHPYTAALLSAVATLGEGRRRERVKLHGEPPSPANPPAGCVFQNRCQHRIAGVCDVEEPALRSIAPGHELRCHLSVEHLRAISDAGGQALDVVPLSATKDRAHE
jgi:peptide/nickel transport system ATP-binding protein